MVSSFRLRVLLPLGALALLLGGCVAAPGYGYYGGGNYGGGYYGAPYSSGAVVAVGGDWGWGGYAGSGRRHHHHHHHRRHHHRYR